MISVRVHSAEEWRRLRNLAEAVFDLNGRLPAVVSSLLLPDAPFFDGDVIFGEPGWGLASSLALVHGDPVVNVLVVRPDAAEFLATTGQYGCFFCRSDGSDERYLAGLFGEPSSGPVGQIGYAAETLAIFGMSGLWGIWVERNIAGLAVSADPSVLGRWELDNGPFMTADDALDGFLGMNLGGVGPESEFANSLRRNYCALPDRCEEAP